MQEDLTVDEFEPNGNIKTENKILNVLNSDNCPNNSYLRAMRHYSENKNFNDHDWVNNKLVEFGFNGINDLPLAQKTLLSVVINAVRKNLNPNVEIKTIEYPQGESTMTSNKPSMFSTMVSQLKTQSDSSQEKPKIVKRTIAKQNTTVTRVIKVGGEQKKTRKSEKFNILLEMLKEAGKNKSFVSRETIAAKIGATPGSVGVMISELRKDPSMKIDSDKRGYRINPEKEQKAA